MTTVFDPHHNGVGPKFTVLFVCTANQARSPIAQFLLQRALDALDMPWTVHSAGTDVVAGQAGLNRLTFEALAEIGITDVPFQPRQLTERLVAGANLILTASAHHRHRIVLTDISALRRSFTLLQFARYTSVVSLESTAPNTLGADLLAGATIARSRFQPVADHGDDIRDPVGGKIREFRMCRDTISKAIDQLVAPLAASPAIASAGAGSDATAPRHRRTALPAAAAMPSGSGLNRIRRTFVRPSDS